MQTKLADAIINNLKIKVDIFTSAIIAEYVSDIKLKDYKQYLQDILEYSDEYLAPMIRLSSVTKLYREKYKQEYIHSAYVLLGKIDDLKERYSDVAALESDSAEALKLFTPLELQVILKHGGLRLMFDNAFSQEDNVRMFIDYTTVRDAFLAVVFTKEFAVKFITES